ncbi:MAG: hypothetical protein KC469_07175 [Flavobacteriaceae bacterium]|nr:hypothetical protein [Flavobacteriaceae bacterium]
MIPFFRRLRKRFADDNKPMKYTRYAIGEIVLVVIGILIALQINNWNENKKVKAFELKMLKELSIAIQKDIEYTENHILGYRTKVGEKSVLYFKGLIKNNEVDMDSLRYYFDWTSYGVSFQINEGPYQALKSIGLDKIANDSLRNSIQLFYDFILPRRRQLVIFNEEMYDEQQETLKQFFLGESKYEIVNDDVKIYKPLVDSHFWLQPKFLDLLIMTESRVGWRRNEFEDLTEDLKTLKKSIDKQIKK